MMTNGYVMPAARSALVARPGLVSGIDLRHERTAARRAVYEALRDLAWQRGWIVGALPETQLAALALCLGAYPAMDGALVGVVWTPDALPGFVRPVARAPQLLLSASYLRTLSTARARALLAYLHNLVPQVQGVTLICGAGNGVDLAACDVAG